MNKKFVIVYTRGANRLYRIESGDFYRTTDSLKYATRYDKIEADFLLYFVDPDDYWTMSILKL